MLQEPMRTTCALLALLLLSGCEEYVVSEIRGDVVVLKEVDEGVEQPSLAATTSFCFMQDAPLVVGDRVTDVSSTLCGSTMAGILSAREKFADEIQENPTPVVNLGREDDAPVRLQSPRRDTLSYALPDTTK